MKNEPFQYQIPKPAHYGSGRRTQAVQEAEILQKYVRGERASQEEYWLSLAWDKLIKEGAILGWSFQPSFFQRKNVPGEVRLDFMVEIPPDLPIQVDGNWIHKSAGQKAKDRANDARLNGRLSGEALPVVRIPTDPYIQDEETAYQTALRAIRGDKFI